MDQIPFAVAFAAGLVSFISPCVLPIIPGFLAYLAGSTLSEAANHKREILTNCICFVVGFCTIFALLGVLLNTVLQAVAYDAQEWLSRIGGIIIIFFGLYLAGLIKVGVLEHEYRMPVVGGVHSRYLTSFLFGAAFAAGWTPCVGAVLGSIIGLAASKPGSAFALFFTYSLGLSLPFLLVGAFTAQASVIIGKIRRYVPIVNAIFGILLVIIGILTFTGDLGLLANFSLLNRLILR